MQECGGVDAHHAGSQLHPAALPQQAVEEAALCPLPPPAPPPTLLLTLLLALALPPLPQPLHVRPQAARLRA